MPNTTVAIEASGRTRACRARITGPGRGLAPKRGGTCTNRARHAGMTLSQVVVASSLLVLAIVPILRALSTAHRTAVIIEQKTQSLAWAQAKLAEIKAQSVYHYGDTFSATSQSLGGPYFCNITDDAAPDLRMVSVAVGCDRDGSGGLSAEEVEVTLTTYIAQRL